MNKTVIDASDGMRAFMSALGLIGSFDIRADGSRSTGWVGAPGEGDEVEVVLTIKPLPPLTERVR